MKKYFLAKQGLELKLFSVLLQNLIISPISLILTYLITSILATFIDADSMTIFKTIFIVLNILWILRNSIVKVSDNRIICKSIIGTNKSLDITEIHSLEILSPKAFKKTILSSTRIEPLITNCFSIIFPVKNVISFKNRYNREVTIGVWNHKKLLSVLYEKKVNSPEFNADKNADAGIYNQGHIKAKCFLKIPCGAHFVLFFKHFFETVLYPAFISLIICCICRLADIAVSKYLLVFIFTVVSFLMYLRIIRVTIFYDCKIIRLNCFLDNSKNVIKCGALNSLHYLNSFSELESIKTDNSKINIITPVFKKHFENTIVFETENRIRVVLSISDAEKIFKILETFYKEPEN